MTSESAHFTQPQDEQDLDLREVIQSIISRKVFILLATLIATGAGGIYAYFVAKVQYTSSALLIPVQSSSPDQLGAAAALFGKKGSGNGDLDLYQSLLSSRTVMHKLVYQKISNLSDTGKGRLESIFSVFRVDTSDALALSNLMENLSSSISVGSMSSGASGILEVKISSSNPWLAKELGNSVLMIGQEELRQIRIERSEIITSRLGNVVEQAKAEWDSAAQNLSWFKDRNRSILLASQSLTQYRLEIEKQAKEQKYLLAKKEFELQLLEKEKATPPMMILDPANLPVKKSKPNRKAIILLSLVGGVISSIGWILISKALSSYKIPSAQ